MTEHKFKVGQIVEPTSGPSNGGRPRYEIVSLVPSEGQEPRYRVKREGTPERWCGRRRLGSSPSATEARSAKHFDLEAVGIPSGLGRTHGTTAAHAMAGPSRVNSSARSL